MRSWARLLRISHWIKNLLVLLPVVFAGKLFDIPALCDGLLAFACFCLASSAVYVINDVKDVDADRLHPKKSKRPLASGEIKKGPAIAIAVTFIIISLCLSVLTGSLWSSLLLGRYVILNIAYSMGLKNIAIVDIAILASGYVLRVLFGGTYCGIPVSLWLFLTILTFAMYFAFGKRGGELGRHGTSSRKSLEQYTMEFLRQGRTISLVSGIVFYTLWSYERTVIVTDTVSTLSLLVVIGVPLVIAMCLRYNYLLECSDSDGDPVDMLIGDKALLILLFCWVLTIGWAIYAL